MASSAAASSLLCESELINSPSAAVFCGSTTISSVGLSSDVPCGSAVGSWSTVLDGSADDSSSGDSLCASSELLSESRGIDCSSSDLVVSGIVCGDSSSLFSEEASGII